MVFNSYIFLFIFIPITLCFYWYLNKHNLEKTAKLFLIGMSILFYAYADWKYCIILGIDIVVNFFIYKCVVSNSKNDKSKIYVMLGISFNILLLAIFKYFNFFVDGFSQFFGISVSISLMLMPMGLSVLTFQQISFIVDSYKNKGQYDKYTLIDYVLYIMLFTKITAGPIVFHYELIPQFNDKNKKKFSSEHFSQGLALFIIGLSKKVLLADAFKLIVDIGYQNVAALNSINAWIVMLSYTFEIYFDFSGYSDMAIGVSKMLSFDIAANFNSPYKAGSVSEFWQRWHISLTKFLRKYIYIPLGGNQKGKLITYRNILIVYLISGIWHGANGTFLFWGVLHGVAMVIEKVFKQQLSKLNLILRWIGTFLFINITWVFFRANSISDAFALLRKLISCNYGHVDSAYIAAVNVIIPSFVRGLFPIPSGIESTGFYMLILIALTIIILLQGKNSIEYVKNIKRNRVTASMLAILFILSILYFAGADVFIYSNF